VIPLDTVAAVLVIVARFPASNGSDPFLLSAGSSAMMAIEEVLGCH